MQPFMGPNSGLTPSFAATNFQYNPMQQTPQNYPYQLSPQPAPYVVSNSRNNSHAINAQRTHDNQDNFYQHEPSTYGNLDAMLHEPTTHLTGNLLGEELSQPLPDMKRPSQVANKYLLPVVKTEPTQDGPSQCSEPTEESNIAVKRSPTVTDDTVQLTAAGTKVEITEAATSSSMQPEVKEEALAKSTLICD